MGYVYRYTHKKNKMWYIGSHNGNKKKYIGSGLIWRRAIKKYGIDSFDREILYEGDDYRQVEEKFLKDLDAVNNPLSYNMKNEALGGTFFGKKNGMFGKKHSKETRYKCGSAFRGKSRPDHSKNMKNNNPMQGQTYHTYGLKLRSIEKLKGKTLKEIYGEEKAKEIKNKIRESHLGKKLFLKQVTCPHCGKSGKGPNMTRYHFDKCKKLSYI